MKIKSPKTTFNLTEVTVPELRVMREGLRLLEGETASELVEQIEQAAGTALEESPTKKRRTTRPLADA